MSEVLLQPTTRYRHDRDVQFVTTIMQGFFSQSHVKNRLDALRTLQVSNVERWLQVEMALYFQESDSVAMWERELPLQVETAKKGATARARIIPDFVLMQAGLRSEDRVILEVKANVTDAHACLNGLCKDHAKYRHQRHELFGNVSSLLLVGLHPKPSAETNDWLWKNHNMCISSQPIRSTRLHFSVSHIFS
ncbi:hypothetical protein [Laribacter hongkongensis]|uniref:hypothetical protein n=1 Tax=Laribacter hongkongensis TaxID=168471 RepID=UPI001EFE52A1|nr:hypothetical protein [Laribacter hongkongensis]MCG9032675.1 hypothetical protein [Laribacter hongkongensis]MCG9092633.1 hypothetical protein [Laribacter hongkongensis]